VHVGLHDVLDQPEVEKFHDLPAERRVRRAGVALIKLVKLTLDQSMFLPVPGELGIATASSH
jgi:hypothetical protein